MNRRALMPVLLVAGCAQTPPPNPAFDAAFAEAVPVCEVRAHPEAYLGRSFLIRGRYQGNDHGSGLWLEECRSAWTDLRGSEAVTEDPRAAHVLNRLQGRNHNLPNEVVYRGMLQREPQVTVGNGEVVAWRYRFEIERLIAAKPAPAPAPAD